MSNKVILTVKQNNNRQSIQNIKLPSSSPSPLINYYTKKETDNFLNEKLDILELNNSINKALKEAKNSGEFDGEQGPAGPKGLQGAPGIQGPQGIAGKNGKDGKTPIKGVDYFTDDDKQKFIADLTPTIESLINQALGDIENGTY